MTERESPFRSADPRAQARLTEIEGEWKKYLDWADENDDDWGHVGFSRRYRARANELLDEAHRIQQHQASLRDPAPL